MQNTLGEYLLVRVEKEKDKVESDYTGKMNEVAFDDINIVTITYEEAEKGTRFSYAGKFIVW